LRRPRLRLGPVALLILLAAVINAFGQGFSRFTYPLLLPDMRDDMIHSYALAGLLGTINLVAYLCGVLLVSRLSGRVSSVRIVVCGLALGFFGSLLLTVAPNYAVLVLAMVLAGGGAAGTWIPVAGAIGASVEPARRGTALGLISTGFGAAVLVSSQLRAVIYAVEGDGSWRTVWGVQTCLILATLFACLIWFRPAADASAGRTEGAIDLLRGVPGSLQLTLAYTALALGYIVYASFLTAILQKEAHFSASHASTVYSLVGVTSIAGAAATGRLADRFGWRTTYVACAALMCVCAGLVLLRREPWALISAIGFGLPLSSTGSLVVGYLSDHLHGAAIASVFGIVTIPFGVTQACGPWIGGWLRDSSGSFSATFVLSAAAFALAAVSAYTLPRRGRVPLEAHPDVRGGASPIIAADADRRHR
jgi:predicted MFS family arabinose efflux permease